MRAPVLVTMLLALSPSAADAQQLAATASTAKPATLSTGETSLARRAELLTRAQAADPNAPSLRWGWINRFRGRMALAIALLGELGDPGWVLALTPLIELHNEPGHHVPVPYQLWRGRFVFELAHRFAGELERGDPMISIALLVEHESDHQTSPPSSGTFLFSVPRVPAFQYQNALGARGSAIWPINEGVFAVAISARLHVASCTIRDRACEEVTMGGTGPDLSVELVYDHAALTTDRLAPFASLGAHVISATAVTALERRAYANAGVRFGAGFQLYLSAVLGHDVGLDRHQDVAELGAYIAWAPIR